MFKKFVAAFATIVLGVGLSVVAVTLPAGATAGYPTGPDANQPGNWQLLDGETCIKIEPVTVVPYVLPDPPSGRTYSKIVVKAGSDQSTSNPNAVFENPTPGQGYKHPEKDSISHIIVCTVPIPFNSDWQYAAPTCEALTVNYPADIPEGQANDVNVKILYGANYGTELTLNFHNSAGTWSGTQTFTYATHPNWPANIGPFKVVWTQVAGTNYHWQGEVACNQIPADASASVTEVPPTCQAAAQLVLNTPVNATWGPILGNYSVTATAVSGHTFAGGALTQTFTGTLAPKLSSTNPACVPPPVCIPRSAVSYTYDPTTNSGVITVNDVPNSSGQLCQGFWVTATSWKYTTNSTWPQVRDVVQKLPKITSPGTYPYAAAVNCGQGDIYASFNAQPDPTENLYGPSNPFQETFLHNMGFTGVGPHTNPTWVQQNANCIEAPVAIPIATKIVKCGTYGSVSVPADTEKIDYTLTGNGMTGVNVVTAAAIAPYVLKNYPAGGWSFDLGQYVKCAQACTSTEFGGKATNLDSNGWDFSQSRSGGHQEYVGSGLRIYTDAADYNGKSAGYVATPTLNLEAVGTPVLNFTNTSGGAEPGINLSLIVNGVWQGNLVKEPLFPQWWLGKAVPGMPAGPNPGYQKAYGSLEDFLFAYGQLGYTGGDVKVVAIGFSLGSGAKGDGIITSITAGCVNYTFGSEEVAPTATYRLGACYPNGQEPERFSTKNLYIILDNSGSTVPVTFTVVGAQDVTSLVIPQPTSIVRTLAPGEVLEVETTPIWDQGGGYTVTFAADGATIPDAKLTVPPFEGCLDGNPGDPVSTDQQCVSGRVVGGSITVGLMEGFTYTITGPAGFQWVSDDIDTVDGLAPGTYEVTVKALPGYVLIGDDKWPYEVKILAPENCVLVPIPVIVPQSIACDADGSFTLPSIEGVTWFVDGVETAGNVVVTSAKTYTLTYKLSPGTYWDGTPPDPWELVFANPTGCVVNDADATIATIDATCVAPGSINTDPAKTSLTNASWTAPLPTAPGGYTVTAQADAGHAFAGGGTTKDFSIVIQEKILSSSPLCNLPTEGLSVPTYTFTQATCTAPGSYIVGASINPEFVQWREQGSNDVIPFNTKVVVNPSRTVTLLASSTDPIQHGLQAPGGKDWVNPIVLTFTTPSDAACDLQLRTLALTGLGSGLGLTLAGGLVFLGIGGLLVFARRRQLADNQ
ncbi:MAG: hypothetical protein ACKVOG_04065 [Rhodoglobus sp.]